MEIVGIGSEIVECLRIGKMIELHGEQFLRRVFTDHEIRYCQSRRRATEHFAGQWAAKEAVVRAIGMTWTRRSIWTDLEVRSGRGGKSQVMVCGSAREIAIERGIGDILVSISHCRTYATAYAMAIARPPKPPAPKPEEPGK